MSSIEDLSRQTEDLADEVSGLRAEVARLRRAGRTTLVGVLAVLVLVVVVGTTLFRQLVTEDRLRTVVSDVLCPVFALVVGGYDPDSRPAGAARDTYEQTFTVMRNAYGALQCTGPLVPPRAGQ